MSATGHHAYKRGMRSGVVLLIVLVLLVLLSMLGYTVSSRVLAKRHRDNYIINYTMSRYGCDSAMKYALTNLARLPIPQLVYRPNEPDFSDLFSTNADSMPKHNANAALRKTNV